MTLTKSVVNRRENIPVGLLLITIFTVFFMVRYVQVALSRNIMGNHAYVQMINSGIPMLNSGYYNEEAYLESDVTVESLVLEALWIDKINISTILSFQIPGFQEFASNNELVVDDGIKSFTLTDNSIEKTPEVLVPPVEDGKNSEVRNPNIVKTLDQSKPEVLLYSSHTVEAFGEAGHFNDDINKNILGVGALVEKELEEYYGISVIHDKTMYAADYNNAYIRSRDGVKKYVDKYSDLKLVVDLHRDGGPKNESVTAKLNDERVSRLMFVNGKNNPHYESSNKTVQDMVKDMNEFFPGLSRGVTTYNRAKSNSYNQDLFKNAVLMEVGSENSTVEEAMNSAKYIARLIAEEVNRR
ncbi:MAG: stage II sporulation protein P [Sarcina sp.]